jgi:hypothetical protein
MAGIGPATSPLPRECSTTEPHGQLARRTKHHTFTFNTSATGQQYQLMERETGIEPASLAWKARVLPLNYSRIDAGTTDTQHALTQPPHYPVTQLQTHTKTNSYAGGEGWIRTSVLVRGQIYSLLPLTTRPPLHNEL